MKKLIFSAVLGLISCSNHANAQIVFTDDGIRPVGAQNGFSSVPILNGDASGRSNSLRFAIISDLTGGERPGVFRTAVETINAMNVDFVLSIGDQIQGLTVDRREIERQWDEFERSAAQLNHPLVMMPGNHDIFSAESRRIWEERHGATYFAFRRDDILFVVLNTEDRTDEDLDLGLEDMSRRVTLIHDAVTPEAAERVRVSGNLLRRQVRFPDSNFRYFEGSSEDMLALTESDRQQGLVTASPNSEAATLSDEQLSFLDKVLKDNSDVRWTFVFMHKPIWIGAGTDDFHQMQTLLGDRPYTVFAGHLHRYKYEQSEGQDHIMLGASGGNTTKNIDETPVYGSYDHITIISLEDAEPLITNILLEGVYNKEGRPLGDAHGAQIVGGP